MTSIIRPLLIEFLQQGLVQPRVSPVLRTSAVDDMEKKIAVLVDISKQSNLAEFFLELDHLRDDLTPEKLETLGPILDNLASKVLMEGKAHHTEGESAYPSDSSQVTLRQSSFPFSIARVDPPQNSTDFSMLKDEYEEMFDGCVIRPESMASIAYYRNKIEMDRSRYRAVAGQFIGMPWWFVAFIHGMEGSFNFNTHLHNGDPLSERTIHVPRDRPQAGDPPFTWEESAKDALTYKKYNLITDWSLEHILYLFEKFNGFGYRRFRGIHTPYLWSFSTYYTKGKYRADGVYDQNLISRQCGTATLLRDLVNRSIVSFGMTPSPDPLPLSEKKRYSVTARSLNVRSTGSMDAVILGTLDKGDIVELQDNNSENYWLNVKHVDGHLTGFTSHKYLSPLVDGIGDEEFPWFSIALGEEGTREVSGPGDNPRIIEYNSTTTLGWSDRSNDETPWCSTFVNWCVENAGYAGTDSAWAKSWRHWGRPINNPRKGCIVVFDRDFNGQDGGHVGFYLDSDGDTVEVFGGNQSNSVKRSRYPKNGTQGSTKYKLLGYRVT